MRTAPLLAFLISLACLAQPVLPPLFYAVVSDTQKPASDALDGLREVVGEVNQLAPTFVLMPGDLTDQGRVAEYENVLPVIRSFAAPVYALPGNHEGPAGQSVYRERYREHLGENTYTHRVVGGWHLFCLDSVLFANGKLAHEGGVDAAQLAWVKQELAKIPSDAPILLSQHHPLRYAATKTENEEELLALFSKRHLPYTVTGHLHYNDIYQDYDAIWHIVTGAVAFSCRPKTVGTGYRLVSTVGQDLWTAWIDIKDPAPARKLVDLRAPQVAPVQTDKEQLLLRVRYTGEGELTFRATAGTPLPIPGKTTVTVGKEAASLRVRLSSCREPGTAVVPLPKGCTGKLFAPGCLVAAGAGLAVQSMSLWESTASWQHLALKRPGETRLMARILSPRPGAKIARGKVPVVVLVEGRPAQEPEVRIGSESGTPSGEFVSVLFQASGLQSKTHGFRNCVYLNDQYLTDIAPDRDVLKWEWFAFPVPTDRWRDGEKPQFRLTAGTPEDGSGANPPANNEDYTARDLLLLDGDALLSDPALPPANTIAIGDNGKTPRTLVDCVPSATHVPRRWRAVLRVVDTTALQAGPAKVVVDWASAKAEIPVTLLP